MRSRFLDRTHAAATVALTLAGFLGGLGLAGVLLAAGFGWSEAFVAYGLGAPALLVLLGDTFRVAPPRAPVRRVAAAQLDLGRA